MNTHPEKWYIPLTDDNYDEVKSWWLKQAEKSGWGGRTLPHDVLVLSEHPWDFSHYWGTPTGFSVQLPEYQKITLEQFREITNPHPKKWCIEITANNHIELNAWRRKVATTHRHVTLPPRFTILSNHEYDGSYYYSNNIQSLKQEKYYRDYQEITLEQFRQITNSTPIPMPKTIQISRQLLNEYYDAATTPQKEYLIEHFKLDGTTTDEAIRELHAMACERWKPRIKKNHPDCFPEESKYFDFSGLEGSIIASNETADKLGMYRGFIQVRNNEANPETHNRSFYLSSRYNWELKHDGSEDGKLVYVLIPTKK